MVSPTFLNPTVPLNKIAIFANVAGGKSTLSNKLGKLLHHDIYHLDQLLLKEDLSPFNDIEIMAIHDFLLSKPGWIIEGFGTPATIELRINAADTLIFIDLPLSVLYYRGIKRRFRHYLNNLLKKKGTIHFVAMQSLLSVILSNHKNFRPIILNHFQQADADKCIIHLKTTSEVNSFLIHVEENVG